MQIQPKFTRLSQKKAENKMNDEYMNYLEEKGRKILGLNWELSLFEFSNLLLIFNISTPPNLYMKKTEKRSEL